MHYHKKRITYKITIYICKYIFNKHTERHTGAAPHARLKTVSVVRAGVGRRPLARRLRRSLRAPIHHR